MKRVKFFIFLLPAIILLFTLPRLSYSAYSDSETFEVTKDTFANSVYNPPLDYRDNNYGGTGSVVVSNEPIDRLGYLQFEDIDLPEGAILDSATLKFYVHEQSSNITAKLNVGPVTGDWEEDVLTWNNKPTVNQTQAIEAEISLNSGWKEISLTNLVSKWLDGTIENKGVFIYPYGFLYGTAETDFAFSLKTKESGDLAAKLEVTYHFEPSPSPSPVPSPSPSPSPEIEEEETIGLEEPSPEESPSPSPEAEKGKILGIFSTGQALIAVLILLALIGAGTSFAAYARRKPKKEPKKKPKGRPAEEEEKPEPEEKEESKEEEES